MTCVYKEYEVGFFEFYEVGFFIGWWESEED